MFLENTVNPKNQGGWIEVICGSMFSGKTEELIRRIKRVCFAKQNVVVFKPEIDTRYSNKHIVSHSEQQIEAHVVEASASIPLLISSDVDVIAIDEAQFFDLGIVDVCNHLANNGFRVIVAGLDMDYIGRPFGPMPNLMAVAEYVTKLHAICVKTGNLAQYSHRKIPNEDLVLLGEKVRYEPLSRQAFHKAMKDRFKGNGKKPKSQ